MNINTILVALGNDPAHWTIEDPLIRRASVLAKQNAASLVLLNVAYNSSLGYGAFASREEVDAGRLRLLADSRDQQSDLQKIVEQTHALTVSTETLWGPDESDCVLRTARARDADLIMKASDDHSYFLGLFSNTDWDLLRNTDVPVWFVARDSDLAPESGIIAAVDQSYREDADAEEEFRLDHEAFAMAKQLSDEYASPLYAVHAYQPPRMLPGFEGYVPSMGATASVSPAVVSAAVDDQARADIAQRHGQAVQDFVDYHGIPIDDLILEEGSVDQVLSRVAQTKGAGLIVMGSSSKSWWDHLRGRASAEPTLSSAACDVLFVKAAHTSEKQAAA